jgi:L-rhamnonate dehydratase
MDFRYLRLSLNACSLRLSGPCSRARRTHPKHCQRSTRGAGQGQSEAPHPALRLQASSPVALDPSAPVAAKGEILPRSREEEAVEIVDVEAIHLRLPNVAEIADGTQDVLLIRITTDTGIVGIGEASSCSYVCRAIVEAPRSASRRHGLREILVGQNPLHVAENWQLMYQHTKRYGRCGVTISAIGGADLALWDIRGKALGQPVHALLGRKRRERVRAYASYLFGDTLAQTAERARAALYLGLGGVKFGWGPFGRDETADLAHVEAARCVLGDDVELMVDAGCAWSAPEALERAKKLAAYDIAWLEEPLDYEDLEGYAWLCSRSPIPIAGGEMATTTREFRRYVNKGGLHIIQPDVAICGGLTVAREASEIAYAAGRRTVAHAFSTGVCLMASLHWMASRPDGELVEYCLSPSPFMRDLVTTQPTLEDGFLQVPDIPGLGIELDQDVLDRHRLP